MRKLDEQQQELESLIKRRLNINPGLETVTRRKEYKSMMGKLSRAMREQVIDLLDSGILEDVDAMLGPIGKAATRIHDEDDDLDIEDAIRRKIKPIDSKASDAFVDFLILIFNLGGQDFLNKHNIPVTFNLTNEGIKSGIKTKALGSIKGIDDTTAKWVKDQIAAGRKNGLLNSEIGDKIKEKVPETYAGRSERIVRTESSDMVGRSEHETANRNGASHKDWVVVPDNSVCEICLQNEAAGTIGINQAFPSGDMREPAHPNCRCLVEYQFTPFMGSIWSGQ